MSCSAVASVVGVGSRGDGCSAVSKREEGHLPASLRPPAQLASALYGFSGGKKVIWGEVLNDSNFGNSVGRC